MCTTFGSSLLGADYQASTWVFLFVIPIRTYGKCQHTACATLEDFRLIIILEFGTIAFDTGIKKKKIWTTRRHDSRKIFLRVDVLETRECIHTRKSRAQRRFLHFFFNVCNFVSLACLYATLHYLIDLLFIVSLYKLEGEEKIL